MGERPAGACEEIRVRATLDEDQLYRDAVAPRIDELAPDDTGGRQLEVGVGQHDRDVATGELQYGGTALRGVKPVQGGAGGRAAREEELVDALVHHLPRGLRAAHRHLEQRLRQAGTIEDGGRARGERRPGRRGFPDHRIAGHKRRGNLGRRQEEKRVTGRYDAHNTIGLPVESVAARPEIPLEPRSPKDLWAENPRPAASDPAQSVERRDDLGAPHLGWRAPGRERDGLGDRIGLGRQDVRRAADHARTISRLESRPITAGPTRGGDCRRHSGRVVRACGGGRRHHPLLAGRARSSASISNPTRTTPSTTTIVRRSSLGSIAMRFRSPSSDTDARSGSPPP